MASFCPSSLSLDDFKKYPKSKSLSRNSYSQSTEDENFIPPSSKVSIIQDLKPETPSLNKSNRFSYLVKNSPSTPKTESSTIKVDYSIPNIQTINTLRKSRPILVVSLSSNSLSPAQNSSTVKKETNIQTFNHIIGEAIQIDTEITSDSESD